eukprot:scaffold1249_cov127-Skeletonema_menzelii.AAC.4
MSSLDQIRDRLEKEAGVSPSITWLDRCLRHIRQSNNSGGHNDNGASIEESEVDGIWDQIRHSDLRTVIRGPSNDADFPISTITAAMQLRRAMAQSKTNSSSSSSSANNTNGGQHQSSKVCLPEKFKLMIQLEEVVDATMNSEQQLASMGGNHNLATSQNGNNNNNGNNNYGQGNRSEKWRCLKMIVSDGYYPNGRAASPSYDEDDVIIYAMETSPITNLSTASVPGTKILLHGPIQIRFGLLQLSDENSFVIGGQVPSWRDIWTTAREKAQREKGLGVDPTIKALIWNPLMGDEEEVDEGERESGDVTVPRAPPPPVVPQQLPVPNQSLPVITPNHSAEGRIQNQGTGNIRGATQNRSSVQNPTTNNSSTSRAAGNLRQTTLDAYPKQKRTATTNPYQRSNQDNTTTQQTTIHNTNPYQQKQQQQQQVSNPYVASHQRQQPTQQKTNPYASLRPSRPSDTSSTFTASLAKSLSKTGIDESKDQDDTIDLTESPANASNKMDTSSVAQTSISTATPRDSTPSSNADSSKSGLSGILSFSEFKALMQSLRHNRVLYEEYYGKEIIVLCKISPGNDNKIFNVVKGGDKKSKVKKDKKYKFFLVSTFYGPKQSDGPIACQVESVLMEPFFQVSPGEIRKLTREDRERSNRIVTQSSTAFIHELSSLGRVHIKLMLTADEFFEKISSMPSDGWLVDTKNPLLLVVKRTSF